MNMKNIALLWITIFFVTKSIQIQSITVQNHILPHGKTLRSFSTDWFGCMESCFQNSMCSSYNYWFFDKSKAAENGLCELNRCGLAQSCGDVDSRLVFQNGAIFQQIHDSQEQDCIERGPTSCADIRKATNISGLYNISTAPGHTVEVYCDQTTDGGGWTIIQRRINGNTSFYRGWEEYKRGFGNKSNEFWLGLEDIYIMTSREHYKIRIDLKDCNLTAAHAQYDSFRVGDESDHYKLSLGAYEQGDAGDSLSFQNNMKFSTFDSDNDQPEDKNCAVLFKGAWWYSNCHYSNLNGEYKCGHHASFADGMTWQTWRGFHYSVKETEIKIRPVDFQEPK